MEDRRPQRRRRREQLFVGLGGGARTKFDRVESGKRRLGNDPAGQAQRLDRDLLILVGCEISRRDQGCHLGIGARRVHRAAAGRPQVADAGGERTEAVHPVAPFVERQRLEMELQISRRMVARGFGEHAELGRRHGQRPAPPKYVIKAHRSTPEQVGIVGIERADAAYLIDRPDLQMILQVGTNAGQCVLHRDAGGGQGARIADPRQLQQLRRPDRAGGEDDFAARTDVPPLVAAPKRQSGGTLARQHDALDLDPGQQPEIRPLEHWFQKRTRRADPPAGMLVDLIIG
ncbi:hypothetical protein BH10PSE14_BH10PSE14_02370 [soil metagenome]